MDSEGPVVEFHNPVVEFHNLVGEDYVPEPSEPKYLKVHAKADYYPKFVRVYIPEKPYFKLLPGMEEEWPNSKKENNGVQSEEELARSLRRTKKRVRDYVTCNEFELLATFTFSPKKTADRTNATLVKGQMSNWIKNQKNRNGKFQYLIIPEFHKDKKSLHFHALLNGYKGKLKDSGKKINGRKAFNFKGYKLGHNSAVRIDNHEKVASYVTKYITKEMPLFPGKHRYWNSKGLKLPLTQLNPPNWYREKMPARVFKSDYGLTLYFPRKANEELWNSQAI